MKYYITTGADTPYDAFDGDPKYIGTNLSQAMESAGNGDYVFTVEVQRRHEIEITRELVAAKEY